MEPWSIYAVLGAILAFVGDEGGTASQRLGYMAIGPIGLVVGTAVGTAVASQPVIFLGIMFLLGLFYGLVEGGHVHLLQLARFTGYGLVMGYAVTPINLNDGVATAAAVVEAWLISLLWDLARGGLRPLGVEPVLECCESHAKGLANALALCAVRRSQHHRRQSRRRLARPRASVLGNANHPRGATKRNRTQRERDHRPCPRNSDWRIRSGAAGYCSAGPGAAARRHDRRGGAALASVPHARRSRHCGDHNIRFAAGRASRSLTAGGNTCSARSITGDHGRVLFCNGGTGATPDIRSPATDADCRGKQLGRVLIVEIGQRLSALKTYRFRHLWRPA
jgi:hypothetical protein